MWNEFEYRMKIISRAYVKVFAVCGASLEERMWYPYKLERIRSTSWGNRETCMEYLLDSDIMNEDVTNEEVLEKAIKMDASYVVPKDYLHDREKTTKSIHEFLELYDESECTAQVMIPLQPPHDKHFEELEGFSHYMIGGVKEESGEKQVQCLRDFRQAAGDQVYVHGLGMGGSLPFVKAVRENPRIVDSVDLSTISQAVINSKFVDQNMRQQYYDMAGGEQASTLRAGFVGTGLLHLNYILSPLCNEEEEQCSMEAWF